MLCKEINNFSAEQLSMTFYFMCYLHLHDIIIYFHNYKDADFIKFAFFVSKLVNISIVLGLKICNICSFIVALSVKYLNSLSILKVQAE